MNAVLVPVRSISGAKKRLSLHLDDSRREALAVAMLDDMLAALLACASVDRTVVLSADASLLEHAQRLGADVLEEGAAPKGLNAAVTMAARRLEDEGVRRLLTIPGDVPLIDALEVEALFATDPRRYPVVIVPSASTAGTNALLTSPPTVLAPRFEGESFQAHKSACREAGLNVLQLALGGFAIDVDTVEDLARLAGHRGSRTARLVDSWQALEPALAGGGLKS